MSKPTTRRQETWWDRYRKRDIVIEYEATYAVLANYNAECARGILHTEAWAVYMEDLQTRLDDPDDGLVLRDDDGNATTST